MLEMNAFPAKRETKTGMEYSIDLKITKDGHVVEHLSLTYDRSDLASFSRARSNARFFKMGFESGKAFSQ